MTFYEKIIQELESADPALSTVYAYAFRFANEALFEWDKNGEILSLTYGEARAKIERASAALHARLADYAPGRPVGVFLPNGVDWVVTFWAILRAGYRPLLLNTRAPKATVKGCLREAGAAYAVSDTDLDGAKRIDPAELAAGEGDYCEWADEVILCTSGTTGAPRLVAFDGRAIVTQIRNSGYVLRKNRTIATFYHGHVKLLAFLPFYHIFGLSAVLLWFSCFGRTFVLLPSLSPETIAYTCRLHEVTHIFALPIFWNAVADGVLRTAKRTGQAEKLEKALRLSLALQNGPFVRLGQALARTLMRSVRQRALGVAVRFCITGGGAIRQDTLRLINGVGYPLYNGYGMTEIGIASVELRKKARDRLKGSIGTPFPSLEWHIGGETLLVRGQTCFTARYENGLRSPHDPYEWFDTGDCVRAGDDGCLYFSGRGDDMLNGENGERIAPAEIEAAFGSPLIRNLAAVALPGKGGGTEPVLVVEPMQYHSYALGTLAKQLYAKNDALPSGYRVRRIAFSREPLPLALTMKVQNAEVRRRVLDGTLHLFDAPRSTEPADRLYDAGMREILPRIIEIFQSVTGMDGVTPDSDFRYDLGGDSLTYFTLVERLSESFGVAIDTASAPELQTPRAFAAYLLKEAE